LHERHVLFYITAAEGGGKKKGKSSAFQTISATHRVSCQL